MSEELFKSFQLGDLCLVNRLVLAPMTRNRAQENGTVTPIMIDYYKQRACAGLIVTESTPVSPFGIGYPFTPGIFTDDQVESWLPLTEAVHQSGSYIFIQLQHCGRISHPTMQPNGATPIAPSAIAPKGQAITYKGKQDFVTPRAIEINEIPPLVDQFLHGAKMAKQAGFDGVELHGANGYIVDQFLRDCSNQRTDEFGGTVERRMNLLNNLLDAIFTIWPANRVGVRLSPENSYNSMADSNPQAHFEYFIKKLSARKLAYIHLLEGDMMTKSSIVDYKSLRSKFSGTYIANNGYNLNRAQAAIQEGSADLVAFGIPFLANPDLVRRYKENLPLNEADPSTFYGGDEHGYTDYPFFNNS